MQRACIRLDGMASILVVDDDESLRAVIRTILEEVGHRVDDCHSGATAIERHRSAAADLVVTDLVMPDGDGLWLIREITQHFPRTKVIAISGGGRTAGLLDEALALGAHRILTKPFTAEALIESVNELLHDR